MTINIYAIYAAPRVALGTAIPYGAYDVQPHEGVVNVGRCHATAGVARARRRPWGASAGGGALRGRRRGGWARTAAGARGAAPAAGRILCSIWPITSAWPAPGVTTRPGPASGTRAEPRMFSVLRGHGCGQRRVRDETSMNLSSATLIRAGLRVAAIRDPRPDHAGLDRSKLADAEPEAIRRDRHARSIQIGTTTITPGLIHRKPYRKSSFAETSYPISHYSVPLVAGWAPRSSPAS
ncbi:MAG: hypothetical protein AAB385_04625 [Planctomycetota bacterium]